MKIKELKDFLSTVIPSNDILIQSNVQLYDGHKTYNIESMNYAHAISGGVESEVLYLTVTREHNESKEERKYPSKDVGVKQVNEFKKELTSLLNRYGLDNACNTPDHILADYVDKCLKNYCSIITNNIAWHKWKKISDPSKEEE